MIEFDDIPQAMRQVGKKIAEHTAQWEFLDEERKVVLALMASNQEWSEATRDRLARTTNEYRTHLQAIREARKLMLTDKTEYEALQARFEWYRTKSADYRAEAKLI